MYHVNTFINTDKEVASYERRMSICLQSNGFSFSVTTASGLLLTFGEVTMDLTRPMSALISDIKSFFSEQHIYPVEFQSMRLVVDSGCYTWIPAELYESSQQRRYLETVAEVPAMAMISSSFHSALNAHCVYTSDATLLTAFKVALPGIECCAQPYALLGDALLQRSKRNPVVVAWLSQDATHRQMLVDYLVLRDGQLLLSTRRSVDDVQQLLYASLNVMKRMEVETPDMEMLLCGAVERELFMQLRGYFPHLDLYNGAPLKPQHPDLARLHAYKYATVLSE